MLPTSNSSGSGRDLRTLQQSISSRNSAEIEEVTLLPTVDKTAHKLSLRRASSTQQVLRK